jgi:hypothetical protein
MMRDCAPIVLFTYRRIPIEVMNSLYENSLVEESELFIYSDGFKGESDKQDVLKVREYVKGIIGFKTVKIIEADNNKGLACSIINGVTEIVNRYGKAIVLEDDLIVSSDFLEYMNDALNFYKDDERIWSISGYGPKLPCLKKYNEDLYLSFRSSSWGWATWRDRWGVIDWRVEGFKALQKNRYLKKNFNLGGNDMYKMLELQMLGKIDSWAIRWCYSQFINNMYSVYPKKSKILNNGFYDNKGVHNSGKNNKLTLELSSKKVDFKELYVEYEITQCFKGFHNLSLKTRVGFFLKKYGGYEFMKKVLKMKQGEIE